MTEMTENLTIVPFRKELLLGFEYDGVEKDVSGIDITDIVGFYASLGKAFAGVVGNRVVGFGGVYPLWKDWGSCWLFLNKESVNYKVAIFKSIVSKLDELVNHYGIKVLSMECMDESMEANRLITHLGFVKNKEIKMALYGRKQ